YTNNLTDFGLMRGGTAIEGPHRDSAWFAAWVLRQYIALRHAWQEPAGVLIAGGGLSFSGDREWLNRNVFRAGSERAVDALVPILAERRVLAPVPGQTVVMENGEIRQIEDIAPFLRALSRDQWPSRAFVGDVTLLEQYGPACGEEGVPESSGDEIEAHL